MVERRTLEQEVRVPNLSLPCCVLEQDTLLPESTGNTQEAVAPSRHDLTLLTGTLSLNTNKKTKQDGLCVLCELYRWYRNLEVY